MAGIPLFTACVEAVFFWLLPNSQLGRRIGVGEWLGVFCSFLGIFILIGPDLGQSHGLWLGDVLVCMNALGYAFYLVLVRPYIQRFGSLSVTAWGFISSALIAFPICFPSLLSDWPRIDQKTSMLLLYVVLVPTIYTYILNAWALRLAPPSLVAAYVFVQPLVATALAWFFLGEPVGWNFAVAFFFVFVGLWVFVFSTSRASQLNLEAKGS
ncbi:MAG: DMT family transporter [Deltaproteobacteria bacterium]|nr:DMT family transporter [Deltaproteobacteria bacterium]